MEKPIIAMKFGGTSVSTAERRQMIVEHIRREVQAGYQVALVVSAMGRRGDPYATDTLLDLVRTMGGNVDPRNYSFLFVTGEMISVGVMTHTLQQAGFSAVPLTGGMAGIITEDFYMSANVVRMDNLPLKSFLQQGMIPVVCGGQGITQSEGTFSALGRGGSDTSGVLVGIMAGAERVDIYTDVEYMLAADPRVIPNAPKRDQISYMAGYEMARFGAKVIHPGAIKLGMEHNLPIRIRSTFSQNPGTLIGPVEDSSPMIGLQLISSAQVSLMKDNQLNPMQCANIEQHVGVLTIVDNQSGRQLLCAPSGDTTSLINRELESIGFPSMHWQAGFSLISLVGTSQALPEMDKKVHQLLHEQDIPCPYSDFTSVRSTYIIPDTRSNEALQSIYHRLSEYHQ